MNNKPVAWRKVVGNVTKHYQYNEMGEGTPLYTHPVKELTDEEILEVIKERETPSYMNFARAILRKAQKK